MNKHRNSPSAYPYASRRHSAGFTLLELIISITLVALISVAMYGGLHMGTKSTETGEKLAENMEKIRLLQNFLRREISQAYPMVWGATAENPARVIFRGEAESLCFASILPAHRGAGGVSLVKLSAQEAEKGLKLFYAYRHITPELQDCATALAEPDEKVMLMDKLDNLAFSYYGKQENNETPPRWYEQWENTQALPIMVRVRLNIKGTKIAWSDFTVPLHSIADMVNEPQFVLQPPGANAGNPGGAELRNGTPEGSEE